MESDQFSLHMVSNHSIEKHKPFTQDSDFLIQLADVCLGLITGPDVPEKQNDTCKIYLAGKRESVFIWNDRLLQDL